MRNLLQRIGLSLLLTLSSVQGAEDATVDKLRDDPSRSAAANQDQTEIHTPMLASVRSVDDLVRMEIEGRDRPPLLPAPDESAIVMLVAQILPRVHYDHWPMDQTRISKWLDRYLDALDPQHLIFLQSDIESFEAYRQGLAQMTISGNAEAARRIFERFLQRLGQRVVFVAEKLKTETFEFTTDDRYVLDREDLPRPESLREAEELWHRHLRYEILQEKLSMKQPEAAAATEGAPKSEDLEVTEEEELAPNGLPKAVMKTVVQRYARMLHTLRGFDGLDVLQVYLSALSHVYDPHTDYMGKSVFDNFAIGMNLSLFGIGAVLQSDDGYCKVKELRPGPAMRSKKIKPGDRIVAVAQEEGEPVDVVDMKLSKIVQLIRGPKGTKVDLTVLPADALDPSDRVLVTLVRDEISLEEEEASAELFELPGPNGQQVRIGVIDLPSFYATMGASAGGGRPRTRSTTIDVAFLLSRLKEEKAEGIILDLRNNGGGSLEEAVQLTGLFIPKGPGVQIRDSAGDETNSEDNDETVFYDGPLVVLTSRFSASASEILAAALQDYGRALIVGDKSTHGKGTVQSLIQLKPWLNRMPGTSTNHPGALKVTVRKFYRANGASTQLKGVTPDIVLPSVNNYAEVGESSLENPMSWDTLQSANYTKQNRIQPLLPELQARSATRIQADKEYEYIREDIAEYQKRLADKSVSLSEAQRRQEREANQARMEARKVERHNRPQPDEIAYVITLKDLEKPLSALKKDEVEARKNLEPRILREEPDDETASEEDEPYLDAGLNEAKRILMDLIDLNQGARDFSMRQRAQP